jgi:DNA-binding MarR family transcriptional regulator
MSSPSNPDHAMRVWLRFIRLEARMQAAVSDRLRAIGVSIPQCDVLTTLSEQEGVNQQELAKRLYVTKGNISGLLDRLETAGFVERRSLASDRRQYSIHLTEHGRATARKAIETQRHWLAATFGQLADTELDAIETHLIRLRELMRDRDPQWTEEATEG